MRLKDRVAIITGGSRGIGRATAEVFAQEGAEVIIADVLDADGEAAAAAIRDADGKAWFARTDVTKEEDCAGLMAVAEARWGRLDVLVNNAGVLRGAYLTVEELSRGVFQSVLDVNLVGTFLCTKYATPLLRRSAGGVVLCMASGAGVRGGSSSLAYGASKGGVQGLAFTLEYQLGALGIRVHTICPGGIATPMKLENIADGATHRGESPETAVATARQSLGDPAGVGRVLAFLASTDADHVRGTVFTR